jgi:hypothetical protein
VTNKLRVVVVPVGKQAEVREIDNDLDAMHEILKTEKSEGWCEAFRLYDDYLCIINEEGALPHTGPLPINRSIIKFLPGLGAQTTDLRGQFFVCKQEGPEWVSLSEDEARLMQSVFRSTVVVLASDLFQ